jgi:hypothetical protein
MSLVIFLSLAAHAPARAQSQPKGARAWGNCEPARALSLVREQLSEAKTFENGAQRVAVMTRAAELLWPYEEAQARALLADAFDIASAHYREHGDESTERKPSRPDAAVSGLRYSLPDPRVTVIRAVSPRDPAWAQRLTARAAEDTRRRAVEAGTKAEGEGPGDRLLWAARSLVTSDTALAVSFARRALGHPASRDLSGFIYDVARADRAAADAFYLDALRAYSGADAPSLLQLSAYPFGLIRNLGLQYGYDAAGLPPPGFAPSPGLQRQFVSAFVRLAGRRLGEMAGQPAPQADAENLSEAEMIYAALVALDSLYGTSDRSYAALAAPLKQTVGAMLTEGIKRRAESAGFRRPAAPEPGERASDEGVLDRVLEGAERARDPDAHDRQIITGVQGALRTESVERLEAAAAKVKDETARRQFLDIIYYEQALKELKGGRLDEAARLAEKVDSLEQRAALAGEVAAAELKSADDPLAATRAASLAESVYKSAQRAPESEEKARALLSLTHLYARLDPTRAPVVLYEAVAVINRLPGIDLTRSFVTRAVEGKRFSYYMSSPAPGFSLATVLRELAERDFETALTAAGTLDDRYQRALAVLGLAAKCLEHAPRPEKPAAPPKPAEKKAATAPKPQSRPKGRP